MCSHLDLELFDKLESQSENTRGGGSGVCSAEALMIIHEPVELDL